MVAAEPRRRILQPLHTGQSDWIPVSWLPLKVVPLKDVPGVTTAPRSKPRKKPGKKARQRARAAVTAATTVAQSNSGPVHYDLDPVCDYFEDAFSEFEAAEKCPPVVDTFTDVPVVDCADCFAAVEVSPLERWHNLEIMHGRLCLFACIDCRLELDHPPDGVHVAVSWLELISDAKVDKIVLDASSVHDMVVLQEHRHHHVVVGYHADNHVPHEQEEIVHVPAILTQERVVHYPGEFTVEVPKARVVEKTNVAQRHLHVLVDHPVDIHVPHKHEKIIVQVPVDDQQHCHHYAHDDIHVVGHETVHQEEHTHVPVVQQDQCHLHVPDDFHDRHVVPAVPKSPMFIAWSSWKYAQSIEGDARDSEDDDDQDDQFLFDFSFLIDDCGQVATDGFENFEFEDSPTLCIDSLAHGGADDGAGSSHLDLCDEPVSFNEKHGLDAMD